MQYKTTHSDLWVSRRSSILERFALNLQHKWIGLTARKVENKIIFIENAYVTSVKLFVKIYLSEIGLNSNERCQLYMTNEIWESIRNYYDVYFGFNAIYEKLAKMHGITTSSLFVLYMIKEYPDQCTQRLICEKLCFPKQTVNTILDLLEKKKYILRKVSSYDKRSKNIFFTEAGRIFAESILSDMLYLEESAFSNLPPEERRAMLHGERAFLEQLTNALNTLSSKILTEDGK